MLCPVSLPTPRASTSQAADDATKAGATAEVKERRTFLRVAEAGLIAAHRPVTVLLPAATTILALREASRWLELLVDLNDDHLPRFAGRSHPVAPLVHMYTPLLVDLHDGHLPLFAGT